MMPAAAERKLLFLELNEVPYRVLDAYCEQRPESVLASMMPRTRRYETLTEDRLALDPWVSWPTLHRGVTDETHHILHLGQVLDEVDAEYPPLWRLLKTRGLSVGVFGSLHSSHVPEDVTSYSFYVPDYFDGGVFAHPRSLEPFQELNVRMTRESARNVTRSIPFGATAKFLFSAPSLGLRAATAFDAAAQLVREVRDPALRVRRRAYQPLFMMDLFLGQLRRTRPQFATFYTNHVAAAMHRYWAAAFPNDCEYVGLDGEWVRRYAGEVTFAMDKLDAILGRLVRFVEEDPAYALIVAGSMGQAAIPATKTTRFLTVSDPARFMRALGVPEGSWEARPAMVPCTCVVVSDEYRGAVASGLESLAIGATRAKRDRRPVGPMSFDERTRGFFQFFIQFDDYSGPESVSIHGRTLPLEAAGLGFMAHEDGVNCTAQHVPEGALFVYARGLAADPQPSSNRISTVDIAPSVLAHFGFDPPPYMRGKPSIRLN